MSEQRLNREEETHSTVLFNNKVYEYLQREHTSANILHLCNVSNKATTPDPLVSILWDG